MSAGNERRNGPQEPALSNLIHFGTYHVFIELSTEICGAPLHLQIGVRIEDDILVTHDGAEQLSKRLPRDPEEIERMMAEK